MWHKKKYIHTLPIEGFFGWKHPLPIPVKIQVRHILYFYYKNVVN